jgi:hypothetical protein
MDFIVDGFDCVWRSAFPEVKTLEEYQEEVGQGGNVDPGEQEDAEVRKLLSIEKAMRIDMCTLCRKFVFPLAMLLLVVACLGLLALHIAYGSSWKACPTLLLGQAFLILGQGLCLFGAHGVCIVATDLKKIESVKLELPLELP